MQELDVQFESKTLYEKFSIPPEKKWCDIPERPERFRDLYQVLKQLYKFHGDTKTINVIIFYRFVYDSALAFTRRPDRTTAIFWINVIVVSHDGSFARNQTSTIRTSSIYSVTGKYQIIRNAWQDLINLFYIMNFQICY